MNNARAHAQRVFLPIHNCPELVKNKLAGSNAYISEKSFIRFLKPLVYWMNLEHYIKILAESYASRGLSPKSDN